MLIVPVLTAFLPILTFSHTNTFIWIGMVLMGIVLGVHETVMRSAIADITPFRKRGIGFGLFNTIYGLALLFGSLLMGRLYDLQKTSLIAIITVLLELFAIILYFVLYKRIKTEKAPS